MSRNLSGEAIKKILIFGLILLFSVPFGYYYGIAYWANGVAGAAMGFMLGAILTAVGLTAAGKMEKLLFTLVSGKRKTDFSLREQLESDLQQVRFHKMRKEYEIALRKVNNVLELDPEFPEALFLKARVVWEGFGNSESAISNIEKIQTIVDDRRSSIYRWSGSLLNEIKERDNNQSHIKYDGGRAIAYCGIECSKCESYLATQSGNRENLKKVALKLEKIYRAQVKAENVVCDGCRTEARHSYFCANLCRMRKCCIENGYHSCIECSDFPCRELQSEIDHNPEALDNLRSLKG